MLIVANIILIAIGGLIAYWWANQGFFSALLHLLCVIVAGAVAFAVWEPLTLGLLIRGGGFDNYAWGVTLVGVFAITLVILRIAMDKLVPGNVAFPAWANLGFGGLAGALSAVLTLGIFVIGAGHVQASKELMGFRDYGRQERDGRIDKINDILWVPVHRLTTEFYGLLSVTSFSSPWGSLRQDAPRLDQQVSLIRDSFGDGKGQLAMAPGDARIERVSKIDNDWYVAVRFGSQDFGDRFTLSSSQIRMIGTPSSKRARPEVVHPLGWRQDWIAGDAKTPSPFHEFNDRSHYVSNEPGKESTTPVFRFRASAGFHPRYLQIRGTRFAVPKPLTPDAAAMSLHNVSSGATGVEIPTAGGDITHLVKVTNDVRPLNVSTNLPRGSLKVQDVEGRYYFTSGSHTFKTTRSTGSRKLKIQAIYEPKGTRVVRVDVSRGEAADIFRFFLQEGDDADLALVDVSGEEYRPIGYFYESSAGYKLSLDPANRIRAANELPSPATGGNHKLEVLFYVTENTTLTGFRFGTVNIGTLDVFVEAKEAK
ncbi:MAG: CvpA family protein [Planctomycetes bacterium]|nr:CvpA family protein [Planctomycetota bacterium]